MNSAGTGQITLCIGCVALRLSDLAARVRKHADAAHVRLAPRPLPAPGRPASRPRPRSWITWSTRSGPRRSTPCSSPATSTTGPSRRWTRWRCARTACSGCATRAPASSSSAATTTRPAVSASPARWSTRPACTCAPGSARWPSRCCWRTRTARSPSTASPTWSPTPSAPTCRRPRRADDERGTRHAGGAPAAATDRIRADLAAPRRGPVRGHGPRLGAGGAASDSERDISVGGVGARPGRLFDGFGYTALGHLHGPQTLARAAALQRLAAALLVLRSRPGQGLVAGRPRRRTDSVQVERVPAPAFRRLTVLRGLLAELVASPAYTEFEDDFVSVVLTDAGPPGRRDGPAAPAFPARPGRWPSSRRAATPAPATGPGSRAATTWPSRPSSSGTSATARSPRRETRAAGRRVRRRRAGPRPRTAMPDAAAPARGHRVRRVRRHGRGRASTRWPTRACSCCTARPARARRRCSTRSGSPSTAGCRGARQDPAAALRPRGARRRTEVVLEATIGPPAPADHPHPEQSRPKRRGTA